MLNHRKIEALTIDISHVDSIAGFWQAFFWMPTPTVKQLSIWSHRHDLGTANGTSPLARSDIEAPLFRLIAVGAPFLGCGREANLGSGGEVFKDFVPGRIGVSATAVALIDHD
jgi:hypothetical protein